jgi:hypothetical protein
MEADFLNCIFETAFLVTAPVLFEISGVFVGAMNKTGEVKFPDATFHFGIVS